MSFAAGYFCAEAGRSKLSVHLCRHGQRNDEGKGICGGLSEVNAMYAFAEKSGQYHDGGDKHKSLSGGGQHGRPKHTAHTLIHHIGERYYGRQREGDALHPQRLCAESDNLGIVTEQRDKLRREGKAERTHEQEKY